MTEKILVAALAMLCGAYAAPWLAALYHQGRRFQFLSKSQAHLNKSDWGSMKKREKLSKY